MCRSKASGEYRRCQHHNPQIAKTENRLRVQKHYNAQHHPEKVAEVEKQLDELKTLKASWGKNTTPFHIEVPQSCERILEALHNNGLQPYIVGGSVRDSLEGYPSKDIDIEVYGGTANQIIAALKPIGKVDEVGKAFGVLKIMVNGDDYDISLPRSESKTGAGHKGFEVQVDENLSPYDASLRRDFTLNALMYSHKYGVVIDYHNGVEDYENKVLKPVSEAFKEDPLRVLRGVQMASRFGCTLHDETIVYAKQLKPEFNDLSVERVQTEFQKLYVKGKDTSSGFKALKATEWDQNFPGLAAINDEKLWEKIDRAQKFVDDKVITNPEKFYSATVASVLPEKERRPFVTLTTIGDQVKNEALSLASVTPPAEVTEKNVRVWAKNLTRGINVHDWATLEKIKGNDPSHVEKVAKNAGVLYEAEKDWVTGDDVMKIYNQPPGRWVREALDKARDAQYSRSVSTREELLDLVKRQASKI